MQIEQNLRDEKSERIGLGLRSSYDRSAAATGNDPTGYTRYCGNAVTGVSCRK